MTADRRYHCFNYESTCCNSGSLTRLRLVDGKLLVYHSCWIQVLDNITSTFHGPTLPHFSILKNGHHVRNCLINKSLGYLHTFQIPMKPLLSIFSPSRGLGTPSDPPASASQPRLIALKYSPLARIPVELIQHIDLYLTPASRAAFSLCCSLILSALGSGHLKELKGWDRYDFLVLLERDLPQYIACDSCKRLHSTKKPHDYDWTELENRYLDADFRPCFSSDENLRTRKYIHRSFSYPLFRMAMKRHRQGEDIDSLRKILSPKALTWSCNEISLQRSWLARIVDRSFLVIREQTIVLLSRWDRRESCIDSALQDVGICIHHPRLHFSDLDEKWSLARTTEWKQLRNNTSHPLIHGCRNCTTEFRIDFKQLGDNGSALFVTRWMHLGDGRSPFDRAWRSHFVPPEHSPMAIEYEVGSIAAGFERNDCRGFGFDTSFDFDNISTAKERERLFKQRPFHNRLTAKISRRLLVRYSDAPYYLSDLGSPALISLGYHCCLRPCVLRVMNWYLERRYPHLNRETNDMDDVSVDRLLGMLHWGSDQNPRLLPS